MFKKWYNGVNNYVLDLEQLQRRWSGTPQQKGPPFAVAAPLPQPIPGGSIRNDVDRQRLNRRQVCKELYPSCTTKVAYAFLPRRIHLICLSLPLAGPLRRRRPADVATVADLRRHFADPVSCQQRRRGRQGQRPPRALRPVRRRSAEVWRLGDRPRNQGDFKETGPACAPRASFPQTTT